ncbi:MAG: hypothetical protein VBE63_12285 [Lamprobacter sp.]|uniref:hypothetical protein n=1 Tax=Lamprobacter sp. TaxID=3100796 RepID=UPI002B260442|nr:hypothetical protein [Lamprobacter sp.]MEA3640706.1 hypothetical protein [Lamprobacter sp.]
MRLLVDLLVAPLLALALALALWAPITAVGASPEPRIFIAYASAARVKALALDTALLQGWTLVTSDPRSILFETQLDQPASDGPPGATPPPTTLLRIRTQLEQTATGTFVSASAKEHWWPNSERAWSDDVTQRYRDNLQRALRSLQQRWDQFMASSSSGTSPGTSPGSRSGSGQSDPGQPAANTTAPPISDRHARAQVLTPAPPAYEAPVIAEPSLEKAPVGLWAYDAERTAASNGCDLHDRGATLVNNSSNQELHRVFCTNRNPVMVRCDQQGCRASR